jgi:enediyne biosynthesis protein E4
MTASQRLWLVSLLTFLSVGETWVLPRDASRPLRFREASVALHASHKGLGRGVATWDLNGDGWYDMVVGRMLDQTILYLGHPGGFTRAEESSGLLGEFDAWGFLVLDYDGDGDPDFYISRSGFMGGGLNSLLRFDGLRDGVPLYTDVSLDSGAADPGAGLTSIAADYDQDGDVDIYILFHWSSGSVMPNPNDWS